MDELELLSRSRPDPPPPTAAERAALRAALMDHIAGAPGSPRSRRRPGWGPRALVVAVAAAIVVVAIVVAGATRDGARPPTTAPEGSTTSPPEVPAGPFPAPPYTVEVAIRGTSVGSATPREVVGTVVLHQLDAGLAVMDVSECLGCDPTLLAIRVGEAPPDGSPEEVRAAIDERLTSSADPASRFAAIGQLLDDPRSSPTVRAEVLRALAETEGLEVTDEVRTALGAVGTRFRVDDGFSGTAQMVVDPVDGYLLESSSTSVADQANQGTTEVHTPAGAFAPDGTIEITVAYGRPVPEEDVPEDVAQLAELVRRGGPPGPDECRAATGNEDLGGATLDPPVPRHLAFAYCATG